MPAEAPEFTVEDDDRGLLIRGSRGALRVDHAVAEVFEHGEARGAGRLFSATARELLAQAGVLEAPAVGEPRRPEPPATGPRVSVIVVTYQARQLLVECLRSLQRQQYGPIEVVVVDGGSTDGTTEAVRAVAPGAVQVDLLGNPGFAAANNVGARAASGELLLFLNNDTTLEPDTVGQLVRVALSRRRRLAAVCAMTRRVDFPHIIESLGNIAGMYGFGAGRYAGFIDLGQFAGEGELFSAAFTAVLIPREAFDLVGELDERYEYYYEDVDWSIRARMGGLKIWPASHALVYHRGSASTLARPHGFKRRLVVRNRLLWAAKTLRLRNAVGFARRYVVEDAREVIRDLRRGEPAEARVVAEAWASAAAELPSVWQARKELERWHLVPDEVLFRAAQVAAPLMDGEYPLVNEQTIRGHYLHLPVLLRRARRALPA